MDINQVRKSFLEFFEEKDHLVISSSSLVPHDDPTLLLTSAGMVQIKPYFMGEAVSPNPRLASCQKCFRTTDIESVGDDHHLTFFEMLGNFSVGDYFKKEAIGWAWEFVTERIKLPTEKLWITVFTDDDEAENYWKAIGVPSERIIRCGEKSNFWGPAGETGPCGPCSEIHYDFGEEFSCGPDCDVECGCGRYLEIWNLVFTQYNQDSAGKRHPLPKPNIDTGMGLERTVAILQSKKTVYETDAFSPLIECIAKISGREYGSDKALDKSFRVIAEHGRAVTFLIADGVIPGNEGRGYVLRRILRRAARYGRNLGMHFAFLTKVSEVVIAGMGHQYAELENNRELILSVVNQEEEKYDQTLNAGLNKLEEIIDQLKHKGVLVIPGSEVFKLYDTCGFPIETATEIAAENGLTVDVPGFETEMNHQRERARGSKKFGLDDKSSLQIYERITTAPTVFVGHKDASVQTNIVGLIVDGQS
ncbi:MAG: alanine--tRNA ligase, partial [SAR324 cluster bacterium]|nr:alanine--tRNA ligase [SAR324 cluster bacterium]